MKKIFAIIVVCFAFLAASGMINAEDAKDVDADGYKTAANAGVIFKWRVSGDKIDCIVKAETTGWLAVGFNSGRSMNGANMIIGYVDKSGAVVMEDQLGKGHSHKKDKIQNIENIFGEERLGNTELRFSIPLDSGDPQDKVLTVGQKCNVIIALGSKDNLTTIHRKHTYVVITL